MKITKIVITDLFGVKHVELDGSPIEMRGAKGTGKTSIIDAFRFALTNTSQRDYVVRDGERAGEIYISTDTGLAIDRKKRTDKADFLKVTDGGRAVSSPQSFLNDIFSPLQLNPVEFAGWDKNKQNRAILDLIQFDWTTDWIKQQFGELPRGVDYAQHILMVLEQIQSKNGDYYKRREETNRLGLYKSQAAEEIIKALPVDYDSAKWEEYSLASKIAELGQIQEQNKKISEAKAYIVAYNDKVRGLVAEKQIQVSAIKQAAMAEEDGLKVTIERLKSELKAAEVKLSGIEQQTAQKIELVEAQHAEKLAKLDGNIERAKAYNDKTVVDVSELQAEIDNAEKMIKNISEHKRYLSMVADCEALKVESEALTEKIQLARELPGKVLENATIPVNGLTVKDGIPLINGLPVSNLSSGEKIELCVDIALSKPQNLQIILIDGVEALDDSSREALYQKCKEKGLQIIAARTTNDNEITIVEL